MVHHWFFSIGPLDGDGAHAFADQIRDRLGQKPEGFADHFVGEPGVDLVDESVWYARAMDVDTVRALISAVRAGLESEGVGQDERPVAASVLEDMTTWLQVEYDDEIGLG